MTEHEMQQLEEVLCYYKTFSTQSQKFVQVSREKLKGKLFKKLVEHNSY